MAQIEYTSFEELEDKYIGKTGTPRRDAYEAKLQADIDEYYLGECIRREREEKRITASQLAERVGVSRSQLARLENGSGGSVSLLTRVCNALGMRLQMTIG